jgi:WD40 repeat protein
MSVVVGTQTFKLVAGIAISRHAGALIWSGSKQSPNEEMTPLKDVRIRQIAISPNGRRAALGAFDTAVEIWDLTRPKRISCFDTVLDFGGSRLALSRDGSVVVTADYERRGIAGYDAESGKLIWQRQDLKKVQQLTPSLHTNRIYAGFETGSGCALDGGTGETIFRTLRGVRRFIESPHGPLMFLDQTRPAVIVADDSRPLFTIKRLTFALLAIAFSPDQIAVSEAG